MSTANKIFLGSVHRNNPEQLERRCSVAVKSGMLAVTTGAFPGTFIPHATAGANPGFRYVVKEPILGPVDYTYTVTTETVPAYIPHSGEIYQMRTVAAAYTFDQALASNGDGTLKAANGTTDIVIAYSDEAITTTAGAPFLRVKFL
jgi:hypothetical protein